MVAKHNPGTAPFPQRDHEHGLCIEAALERAAAVCADHGVRLTALRRRVLEIIWQSHKPLGAYSILEQLRHDGRAAAPPTVYRALDFLLEQGLVHRIASMNAFVGCSRPGHISDGQFLICRGCGTSTELNDGKLEKLIARNSNSLGFSVERLTIEVSGLCPHCREARTTPAEDAQPEVTAEESSDG
ncbi:MAG: Fur family transcriptional regulator [Gammaproteobacteria bacterium]